MRSFNTLLSLALAFSLSAGCAHKIKRASESAIEENAVCVGSRANKTFKFTLAIDMRIPPGLSPHDADRLNRHKNGIIKYLENHFLHELARHHYIRSGGSFGNYTHGLEEEHLAWADPYYYLDKDLWQDGLNVLPVQGEWHQHELLLIRHTDESPFQFSIVHKSLAESAENPVLGRRMRFNERYIGPSILGIQNRGIKPITPDECTFCKSSPETFVYETAFGLADLVHGNYFLLPKGEQGRFCSAAGLGEDFFTKTYDRACFDEKLWFANPPKDGDVQGCWMREALAGASAREADSLVENKKHESELTVFLLMKAATKVKAYPKEGWEIREFEFDPSDLCKFRQPKSNFLSN